LYGIDQNFNFQTEANERPRGLLAELDTTDESLDRGWSAYLTVSSVENLQPPVAADGAGSTAASNSTTATKIDLNGQDLQKLYTALQSAVGDDKAKFIIVYKQYGPQPVDQQQPGQTPGVQSVGGIQNIQDIQDVQANQNGNSSNGEQQGNAGNNGGNQQPVTATAASLQLDFQQQGGNQINSPLELIGAKVQIPGKDNEPPKNVDSPWLENPSAYRELLKLYDVVAPGQARRVAGRVNINAATRPVLRSIPYLPSAAVGKIVARREVEPDMALSDQRHAIWLLIEGIVTLEEMKQAERFITTGGDAFSGQAVGFFDAGPSASRGYFVIDRGGTSPRLRAWRELTSLGRGFTTAQLGLQPEQ
jgi:DNA uptake protein ComE-like DNA-binding protein